MSSRSALPSGNDRSAGDHVSANAACAGARARQRRDLLNFAASGGGGARTEPFLDQTFRKLGPSEGREGGATLSMRRAAGGPPHTAHRMCAESPEKRRGETLRSLLLCACLRA